MLSIITIITLKQAGVIFKVTRHKLEFELYAAKVLASLRQELMIKESEAQIADLMAAATAAVGPTQVWMSLIDEENEIISKVSPKVLNISL